MKIGLTSYSMNNYICGGLMSVTEVMRFAKEKGAEHIELVPFGFTLHDDKTGEFNEPLIKEILDTSKELDLPLSNYAVLGDLLKEDKDERRAEVERLKRHIDVAAKLGLKYMRHDISSFRRPLESNTPIAFEREFPIAVECCRELADYASNFGITTLVENHGFFVNGSDRVIRLINAVEQTSSQETAVFSDATPAAGSPQTPANICSAALSSHRATLTYGARSNSSATRATTAMFRLNSRAWRTAKSAVRPVWKPQDTFSQTHKLF